MQPLVPTVFGRNPSGRTATEILAALRGASGVRRFSFRYELMDRFGNVLQDLDNVLACKIDQNWLADIKRTATFTIREAGGIDYLSDRIRPSIRLHLPPYGPEDWVEWPQGVFMLSTPKRGMANGLVTREIEAYDLLQIYAGDKVDARYTVSSATQYMTAVLDLVGLAPPFRGVKFPPYVGSLPVAKEWPPGTSKLKIINELLSAINHESLSFDEDGTAVIRPYVSPDDRAEEFTYATDQYGLVVPDVDQELDLFSIANKWVLVVSEPDRAPLVGTYTNASPTSSTSTIRRGRTIVDYRDEQDAIDQATLDARAKRLAFEASQVFESIDFTTAMMPIHSGNDLYRIIHDGLSVNAKYAEHTWSLELKAGATMRHRARRVVTI